MSQIRSHGNKATELRFISILRANRIAGWRRHLKIFGYPDFVFPRARVAIFTDGCLWHGCKKHSGRPVNNAEFWKSKIARNAARDRLVNRTLRRQKWTVLRIWQHALRRKDEALLVRQIRKVVGVD